jgi:CelD/BcsL family acetyltransferase involved in cellulose biosynthesis
MIIELLRGRQALQWIEKQRNIIAWTQLYDKCSWATPYQSPTFARVWLKYYGSTWEPLLLISRNVDKTLLGILALARRNKLITAIGAHQAEYQLWLSAEDDAEVFFTTALETLFEAFPDAYLRLRYIESSVPSATLNSLTKKQKNLLIYVHKRPLIALDSNTIDAVLRKKGNRSKLNRLKRQGKLELICDKLEVDREAILDEIIELYDFRQGATNGNCPFLDDPNKRDFHLEWLTVAPKQLEVHRLCLNGKTIAALIGVLGQSRTSNAILAYSPYFSRQSPGKIHLYLVAHALSVRGQSWLDLTPGGDLWKERFATDHDEVLELNAWASPAKIWRVKLWLALENTARLLLKTFGVQPKKLKAWLSALGRVSFTNLPRRLYILLPQQIEYRIYRMELVKFKGKTCHEDTCVQVNTLADLVRFHPDGTGRSRQQFLASALDRIERGEEVYSVCADNILQHYAWLVQGQVKSYFSEIRQVYLYPEPGTVLYDFYTHPQAQEKSYHQYSIVRMLCDIKMRKDVKVVYIPVSSHNCALRNVIDKLGFEYVESMLYKRYLLWSWCRKVRLEQFQ